jgi:hypothetical protein
VIPILLGTAFSSPDVVSLLEKHKALRVIQSHALHADKLEEFAKRTNDSQDRNARFLESQIVVMKKIIEDQKANANPDQELIAKTEKLIVKIEKLVIDTRNTKVNIPKE